MAQQMLARVTCPACQNPFQAPIQQILDVKEDPNAKMRVLNGIVNVAQCPQCGTQGALSLPFLYHDPEKDLALVYMPMEVGNDNEDRQRIIGKLTSAVMDQLPPEERKGYLLQPQVFLTMENLQKEILKEEGVTEEMIEEQKAKAELLQRMVNASSDEALETMIEENEASIDPAFFEMLSRNIQMARSVDQEEAAQPLVHLRDKLLELTSEGRKIKARNDMLNKLREDQTRDTLLDLLIEAPDTETRELLVSFGRPLIDYLFFQNLTSKIEATSDEDEKERLTSLRKEILNIRDEIDQQIEALYRSRAELLRDLLTSDNPQELAQRRAREMDEVFLNVLSANMEQAQKAGDEEAIEALRGVWNMILDMMERSMPPEVRFFNRLLAAEEEEQIDQLLEENREMVTEQTVQLMEEMEADARQDGNQEAAERMAAIAEKMRGKIAAEKIAIG